MPEKIKRNKEVKKYSEEKLSEQQDEVDQDTWSQDQQKKSYYYDDSYGYEVYDPAEEDDDDL